MRRRTLLKTTCSLSVSALVGTASGATRQESYEPIDSVDVPGATELVVHGDDMAYVAAGDGIAVVDVSDPTDAQHLATIEPPASFQQTTQARFTTAHNCDIDGDRLYTSWYYGGVKVHDISDPETPTELAWWRDPAAASFWAAQSVAPGEYFVASSANMQLVDDNNQETRQAVYAFPDRRGEQADPPSLTGTPTPREGSDGGAGPGFGFGTALAALGGAGYLLGREHSDD